MRSLALAPAVEGSCGGMIEVSGLQVIRMVPVSILWVRWVTLVETRHHSEIRPFFTR